MKSRNKTILFSSITVNKVKRQWPTAVFNTPADAKSYAGMIRLAHASGNAEMAKALDPRTAVGEDGKLHPDVKFSLFTVPYAPTPGDTLSADEIADEAPTE